MYYVYMLQNVRNETDFYMGYSSDLEKRIQQHSEGKNASTKGKKWCVVCYEAYISEGVARDRERKLKHGGRVERFLIGRVKSQFKE